MIQGDKMIEKLEEPMPGWPLSGAELPEVIAKLNEIIDVMNDEERKRAREAIGITDPEAIQAVRQMEQPSSSFTGTVHNAGDFENGKYKPPLASSK